MTDTKTSPVGQFRKYDHLERLGHAEVKEIDYGTVHVFPKIDGTNSSIWWDGAAVRCGSRNRVLTIENDNAGFCAWANSDDPAAQALRILVQSQPNVIVYGEWLVPHTLRTYEDDAWRRFWAFDVYTHGGGDHPEPGYLRFDDWGPAFMEMGIDVVQPLCTMENPSDEQLRKALAANTFLIKDGGGAGEGIVIKNYAWRNRFGRQPWAKVVRNEFKSANARQFGVPHVEGAKQVESEIVATLTDDFVRKEWAKVVQLVANDAKVRFDEPDPLISRELTDISMRAAGLEPDAPWEVVDERTFILDHRRKIIPRFLGTFWLTWVDEECRGWLKKWKNPYIDFGKLQRLAVIKAKAILTEWF